MGELIGYIHDHRVRQREEDALGLAAVGWIAVMLDRGPCNLFGNLTEEEIAELQRVGESIFGCLAAGSYGTGCPYLFCMNPALREIRCLERTRSA